MSVFQPNATDALAEHVRRHADAHVALWQEIDDAVAEAHAELERDRANALVVHPDIIGEHEPTTFTTATNSVEPAA